MGFGKDITDTAPKMVLDFWYILLILGLLIFALIRFYPRQNSLRGKFDVFNKPFGQSKPGKAIYIVLFIGLYFLGFRGGVQFKPLNIISATQYGGAKEAALILNTPFTFLKTFGKSALKEVQYFDPAEAERISPTIHRPSSDAEFQKMNVVVLILESFGREYVGSLNQYKGHTPFLDSLSQHGLWCINGFANGKRSIEGIPAITAGIPALLPEPFITSAYTSNTISSLASILKTKGYHTTFYHGGTNGTMGFDNFSRLAGYDSYYGRKEYNNDDDFDGSWGIYDEPFLQRCILELNKNKDPFFATIFTISSHHPYTIPARYENMFKEGTLPIHKSIEYADYSLRRFFNVASGMPWFKNTLFVLTADHTALSENDFYQSRPGMYAVPILYYIAGDSLKGTHDEVTEHIDILPSVLDLLHFDQPYFAFGKSIFDKSRSGFSISFLNDTYQYINGPYAFVLDTIGENSISTYSKSGKISTFPNPEQALEIRTKAFIQNFNEAMIHNHMTVQKSK
jgi:phosphoglycerol transferase MdoB-like AlkP superfamily enzyme